VAELGIRIAAPGPKSLAEPSFAARIQTLAGDESIKAGASALSGALASPQRAKAFRSRVQELFGIVTPS
jgi:hypothetical protein